VASSGRHTWSHPQLPLATTEENPEVILRKGKTPQGESFASESGISPPPSVKTPFSYSQLPSRPSSEVSHFLNFGSVPAEFSPPGLVSEGEILVTPPSLEVVPQLRPQASEGFTTPPFIVTVAQREASAHSGPLAFSLFSPSSPLRTSFPTSPIHTPSPPSSPPPNIPMAGANPPLE
jgi:hypothetical protein